MNIPIRKCDSPPPDLRQAYLHSLGEAQELLLEQMVAYLKGSLLKQGYRPVCGCDIHNAVSAKTLARGGFACEHRLLKITY